jgi:hypothetical protein
VGAAAGGPDERDAAWQAARLDAAAELLAAAPDDELSGELLALQAELAQQV